MQLVQDSVIGSIFSFLIHVYMVWFLCFLIIPSNEGVGDSGPVTLTAVISQTPSEPDEPAIDTRLDPNVLDDPANETPEFTAEVVEPVEPETEPETEPVEEELVESEHGDVPVESKESQPSPDQAAIASDFEPAAKLKQKSNLEATVEKHEYSPSANAVSKGSFTVWAVPDNPRKGEPYYIVVQVKVPSRVQRYRRSDLIGVVVGTDGYRKTINEQPKGYLPIIQGTVQYVVHIAPSQRSVRDIVQVRSRILRESKSSKSTLQTSLKLKTIRQHVVDVWGERGFH